MSNSNRLNRPRLVVTDLDGTLLNKQDYTWQAAQPALQALAQQQIPLILCSSKTWAEMLVLADQLNIDYPLICENGGGIVVPSSYEKTLNVNHLQQQAYAIEQIEHAGQSYDLYMLSQPHAILTTALQSLTEYPFVSFDMMSADEVSQCTQLPLSAAVLAKQRCATEPLLWQGDELQLKTFTDKLTNQGLKLIKGGRFYHVMGDIDKGHAVQQLRQALYADQPVDLLGLGDSPNDLGLLAHATTAVVIPHDNGDVMPMQHAQKIIADASGSAGWNQAVLHWLNNH